MLPGFWRRLRPKRSCREAGIAAGCRGGSWEVGAVVLIGASSLRCFIIGIFPWLKEAVRTVRGLIMFCWGAGFLAERLADLGALGRRDVMPPVYIIDILKGVV
jgi:hypothetical protein